MDAEQVGVAAGPGGEFVVGAHLGEPAYLAGGRTIVGGLAGGLLAVETTKRVLGIRSRTGELYAIPLCIGIAVGRVGCFLTGVEDETWGVPTDLPWGLRAGDEWARHPTPLYEIAFVVLLAVGLRAGRGALRRVSGREFQIFLGAYMGLRFAVDFLKPTATLIAGLTPIQIVAGLVALHQLFLLARGAGSVPSSENVA